VLDHGDLLLSGKLKEVFLNGFGRVALVEGVHERVERNAHSGHAVAAIALFDVVAVYKTTPDSNLRRRQAPPHDVRMRTERRYGQGASNSAMRAHEQEVKSAGILGLSLFGSVACGEAGGEPGNDVAGDCGERGSAKPDRVRRGCRKSTKRRIGIRSGPNLSRRLLFQLQNGQKPTPEITRLLR
jgi:hypothetical protein